MKNQNKVIVALIVAVAVLALVVIYAFAVRPAINGYATKAYNQGVYDVANAVVQNGYVQIPVSNNQSIVLVQYKQSAQQTQTASSPNSTNSG